MKKKRIIPLILLKEGWIIQSINFKEHLKLGNPIKVIERLSKWMSDEVIYLDISKHKNYNLGRDDLNIKNEFKNFKQIIKYVSTKSLNPITFGGSISSIKQIEDYLFLGADKVSINSICIENDKFINKASKEFGAQCIICSIDYVKKGNSYKVVYKGNKTLNTDLFNWVKKCQDDGCGEILLNSVDRDGKKNGFDLDIMSKILKKIHIPIIFCGGAGKPEDFYNAFSKTDVEALAASNLFHHIEHGDYIIKKYLFEKSINVRKPSFFNRNIFLK